MGRERRGSGIPGGWRWSHCEPALVRPAAGPASPRKQRPSRGQRCKEEAGWPRGRPKCGTPASLTGSTGGIVSPPPPVTPPRLPTIANKPWISNNDGDADGVTKNKRRRHRTPAEKPALPANLPVCTGEGYYTRPSLAELAARPMRDLATVKWFAVGRVGFGEVAWTGSVDVRGLNVDDAVEIGRAEIAVFPGRGAEQLDAPATVKLTGMFSKNRDGDAAKAEMKCVRKLRSFCTANGLEFVDYCVKKGE